MQDTILDLVALIYDAVADPSRWSIFLEAYVNATHSSRGSIGISSGPANVDKDFVCWHGWDHKDIQLYLESYIQLDPWYSIWGRIREGELLMTQEACGDDVFRTSRAFKEFYQRRDVYFGMGGAFLQLGGRASIIFLQRSEKDGPCGERELAITRPLMPHLRRAALLHGELTTLRTKLSATTSHLDRYPQPFFLTNGDRQILYVNEAGREIMRRRDGLLMESDLFRISSARGDAELRRAVIEIAANRESSLRRIVVTRHSGKTSYRLLLMPLIDFDAIPLGVSQPAVAILIIDVDAAPQPDPAVLRELFSLTAAEARVAALLAQGRSVDETAAELSITRETVRTHTRRLLSKTATSRQGELISLVLRAIPFRHI